MNTCFSFNVFGVLPESQMVKETRAKACELPAFNAAGWHMQPEFVRPQLMLWPVFPCMQRSRRQAKASYFSLGTN